MLSRNPGIITSRCMKVRWCVLQYGGDQDDKQWLHEKQHMPATGGRTYLLIADDIRDLAQTDEYR